MWTFTEKARTVAVCGFILSLTLAGCGPRAAVEVIETAAPAAETSEIAAPAAEISERAAPAEECDFVLNPASGKFHMLGCTWAQRIAEDRRIEYSGARETLIEVGYHPCHFCKP